MTMWVKLRCKRCGGIYTLEPGRPISENCDHCQRRIGRISTSGQAALNAGWAQSKAMLNAGGRDPLRSTVILDPFGRRAR